MDNVIENAAGADFLRSVKESVIEQFPQEKAKGASDIAATGRALQAEGSSRMDGLGQKMGSIPGRIYFRWQQMLPGCWQDKQFVEEFLYDNPACCAPGYRPKPRQLRHGFTYTGGAAFYHQNKEKIA